MPVSYPVTYIGKMFYKKKYTDLTPKFLNNT